MITNNHSWSLGSCSNKSFEPDLRLETTVRPLLPGDHSFPTSQSNCVHSRTTFAAQILSAARHPVSTFSPTFLTVNSSLSFTANREISRRKSLISRLCTLLHVNQNFFCVNQISLFPQFPPVNRRPLTPAKNRINQIKPHKNHLALYACYSALTANHIIHLFRKKTPGNPANVTQEGFLLCVHCASVVNNRDQIGRSATRQLSILALDLDHFAAAALDSDLRNAFAVALNINARSSVSVGSRRGSFGSFRCGCTCRRKLILIKECGSTGRLVRLQRRKQGCKFRRHLFQGVIDLQKNRHAPVAFVRPIHLGHRFGVRESRDFPNLHRFNAVLFQQSARAVGAVCGKFPGTVSGFLWNSSLLGVTFQFHQEEFRISRNLPGEGAENPRTVFSELMRVLFEDRLLAAIKYIHAQSFRRHFQPHGFFILARSLLKRFRQVFGDAAQHIEFNHRRRIEAALGGFNLRRIFRRDQPGRILGDRSEGIFERAFNRFFDPFILRGQPKHQEQSHHRRDEVRVSDFPRAAVMDVFFRHYLPMPLSIFSSSSALGRMSLSSPRRAISTAMIGAMPFAKPTTEEAMHLEYASSASPINSMFTASGFKNPYAIKIPRNVPTSAAATWFPISSIGPAIEPIVTTIPSTAATIPKPGIASAARVRTLIGLCCSDSMLSICTSSSIFSWSGFTLPSMIGRSAPQRRSTALLFLKKFG